MYTLQKAQQIISSNIKRLPGESVDLKDGLNRIVFSDITAIVPQPPFDESMRDGYVIPESDEHDKATKRFEIVGEIPAGKTYADRLHPGTACRIMTGGCVPRGGVHVVPFEKCAEQNGEMVVAGHLLESARYIRKKGSEIALGDRVVQSGVALQPMHLALLSSCGVRSVDVSTRPSFGFLCTGSELRSLSSELEKGQKYSSNSVLLEGLSTSFGACPEDLGVIEDNKSDLLDFFLKAKGRGLDFLVTTGGVGPGKYDLVRDAFVEAGGQVVFTALDMRPGKSVLFGILEGTLFFGLPGPSFAVQTLFNVLVGPAILAMQGGKGRWPQKVKGCMQHQITTKRSDVLRLKDGVLTSDRGSCSVRVAARCEISNCYILLQPGEICYPKGALVDVYLLAG